MDGGGEGGMDNIKTAINVAVVQALQEQIRSHLFLFKYYRFILGFSVFTVLAFVSFLFCLPSGILINVGPIPI